MLILGPSYSTGENEPVSAINLVEKPSLALVLVNVVFAPIHRADS